jgi:hypothetical protein
MCTGADDWGVGHNVEAALSISSTGTLRSMGTPSNAEGLGLGERILHLLSLSE